ncbi:MAG: phenylacetate--CoA ligase family protein [bacterium]|nr:phenylacetate--CoA ligase family protein [bacterium]
MGFLWQLYQLKQLMKSQWLRTSQIEEIQQKKLQELLQHAYKNVPYYRQLFDATGVKPDEIKTPADLPAIPITTKSHLRSLPEEQIIAKNVDIKNCVKERTSGSSGMPFSFFFTQKDNDLRPLLDLRILLANGYKLRDTIIGIADSRHAVEKKHWFQHIGLMRKEHVPILTPVEEQIEKIQRMRPDIIWSFTSDLVLIANRMIDENIKDIHPKAVYTMAEFLDQNRRNLLTSVFGVAPFDCYGSAECGAIAWECHKRAGYHMNTDMLVVECIKDGRQVQPGESGELIVTNLHSYAMPFIRYSVGDIGVLSDTRCPCGRGLPMLSVIEGRRIDCIVLPDGKSISPYLLTCAIEDIPGILRYQIIQQENKEITVNFIKGEDFSPGTIGQIKEQCRGVLGDDVAVLPVVTETLRYDKSGKFRVVISNASTHESANQKGTHQL